MIFYEKNYLVIILYLIIDLIALKPSFQVIFFPSEYFLP